MTTLLERNQVGPPAPYKNIIISLKCSPYSASRTQTFLRAWFQNNYMSYVLGASRFGNKFPAKDHFLCFWLVYVNICPVHNSEIPVLAAFQFRDPRTRCIPIQRSPYSLHSNSEIPVLAAFQFRDPRTRCIPIQRSPYSLHSNSEIPVLAAFQFRDPRTRCIPIQRSPYSLHSNSEIPVLAAFQFRDPRTRCIPIQRSPYSLHSNSEIPVLAAFQFRDPRTRCVPFCQNSNPRIFTARVTSKNIILNLNYKIIKIE